MSVDLDNLAGRGFSGAIRLHGDPHAWSVEQAVEAEKRRGLLALARTWANENGS